MADENAPKRPGTRRVMTNVSKLPSEGNPRKALPYVLPIVAIGVLVYFIRSPRFMVPSALALGALIFGLLAYFAWGHRIHLAPDDGLRWVVPFLSAVVFVACTGLYTYTVLPRAAQGEAALRTVGGSASVTVQGKASTVWIAVQGAFERSATGPANYFVSVTHDGATERVDGSFRPQTGGPPIERHILRQLRGPGVYTLRLESTSASVALPVRVSVHERMFALWMVAAAFGVLAIFVLAVDILLRRRGLETSVAAALCLPLAGVLYLQLRPLGENVPMELLAALAVGALGGGLGSELISRVLHGMTGK